MIPEETFLQWVTILEDSIRAAVVAGRNTDDAIEAVVQQTHREFSWNAEALAVRLTAAESAAQRYRKKLESVSYMQKVAIRFGREQWYAGPSAGADNWNGLRQRMLSAGRSNDDIGIVDDESTAVLSLLDNPGKPKFSTRGLVVGHVQSGKTGNIAALIAKAADTPFKFFLVLSGMTDTLRNQTQSRLQRDVVDAASPNRWHVWTDVDTQDQKGEFNHPPVGGFSIDHKKQLAVIKKNGGVLRRFLAKLRTTDDATLRNTPFLIIDDECDQASVNSAALQKAVTKINGYIRQILGRLPRVAYVGYTATPFANTLIDPQAPEDLYPRDFIYALRRPERYFGAERLFGRSALDGEHEDTDAGVDMIRTVPVDELPLLRPPAASAGFAFQVTKSLGTAIKYFVLVTAARTVRGQDQEHSSMLVHTSVLNSVHQSTAAAINPYLQQLRDDLSSGSPTLIEELATLWDEEQDRVLAEQFDLRRVPFDRILPHLATVANAIEVKLENWSSTSRIDYSQPARRYLVIGGNVLARGLTLEGLSVSFFLRSSTQYDTLMQMGRWFGYRPGFEDLPRVWVEQDVGDHFFDLATVETEIRKDIKRYADEEVTPLDLAVRIRRIPGMAITAAAKMRGAVTVQIGYAGSHQQTTRFHRHDASWLGENWAAGEALLATGILDPQGPVVREVPVASILRFLDSYKIHVSHRPMEAPLLKEYIRKSASGSWNVAVVRGKDDAPEAELGRLGRVRTVTRSAMKGAGDEACIKALMSKHDLFLDVAAPPRPQPGDSWEFYKRVREERRLPPLLLLYPIDKLSQPQRAKQGSIGQETREPLGAIRDVLGLGLVFPGSHGAAQIYVAASLPEPTAEEPQGDDAIPVDVTDTGDAP